MKRTIRYTLWKDFEKELLKNPKISQEVDKLKPEYQLARSIIGARLKKKMSQAELAKKIGTKQPVISRLEAMTSTPSVSLLKRVAEALNTRLDIRFLPK